MMKNAIFSVWMFLLVSLHAVEVTAELSAVTVPAGEGVMLRVMVEGGSPQGQPVIPEVKNLVINPRGTSQQMRMMNGAVTRSIAYTYVVGSNQVGDYEVPAITVRVGGKDYLTKPLALKVGASPNAAPAGMDEEEAKAEIPGKYGHLRFQMVAKDRKYVYPGEIAPVKIQAYFPANAQVSLNSMPRPEGSAFTLHNLSEKPSQSMEMINGERFLVVTWFGGLSATKAGEYPASLKLTGTVAVREDTARRRPSGFDDPFGGSLLDDFFAPMVQKDVELITEEPPLIEVKELPKEGRPSNFTGAIGQFEFQSASIPDALKTGEPFQIETAVKGSGNFALLSAPQPLPEGDWKTYEGADEFAPEDVASFGGTKTFRFSAVPLNPGEPEVGLGFSFFDPEKGEYQEVKSDTRKVVITGEVVKSVEKAEAKNLEIPKPKVPQLAPLAMELGAEGEYESLSAAGWFVPVVGGCGFLSLAILGVGWWKSREVDAVKAARIAYEIALREAVETANKAVSQGDAVAFFHSAKNAIQLGIGERVGINPEAVTLADLDDEDGALAEILTVADRVEYSGNAATAQDLDTWNARLREGLAILEVKRRGQAV